MYNATEIYEFDSIVIPYKSFHRTLNARTEIASLANERDKEKKKLDLSDLMTRREPNAWGNIMHTNDDCFSAILSTINVCNVQGCHF